MIERNCGENLLRGLENAQGHGRIATFWRDQLRGIVGSELVEEEKVGGGDGIAQQLDALADERRDNFQFSRIWIKSCLGEEWLKAGGSVLRQATRECARS